MIPLRVDIHRLWDAYEIGIDIRVRPSVPIFGISLIYQSNRITIVLSAFPRGAHISHHITSI